MSELVRQVDTSLELTGCAERLREHAIDRELALHDIIEVLERWGESLRGPALDAIPGVAFLKLWLRRGTLEVIIARELGHAALKGDWQSDGMAQLRAFPVGVVGHWPAANIEIQPMLSLSCGLLGGNGCLVRVPTGLVGQSAAMLEKLLECDVGERLVQRISMVTFEHERGDLQRAMAAAVDGAMIWGGEEAVTQVRSLPFPHWARIVVFGPRLSVAAMDAATWTAAGEREMWCRRIARDVWQFDQQACSSPQTLFLERSVGEDAADFVASLAEAFEVENRAHPRPDIHPALTSAICQARASWLLANRDHRAVFPSTPDWTILLGGGAEIPRPTQGRTLSVLVVDDILAPVARFDGTVQTLGLAIRDGEKEARVALAAARSGVDRIVKLGRMHVFGSPWDGMDIIRPMVRLIRHVPSREA